jgi:hypothetical protein
MAEEIENIEAKTGTRDITYDVISVIYHALQGAETTLMYIQDAEQAGDEEVDLFLKETLHENRERARAGKRLLAKLLNDQNLMNTEEFPDTAYSLDKERRAQDARPAVGNDGGRNI